MKDILIKNIHVFILLYAANNLYEIYTEKTLMIERSTSSLSVAQAKMVKSKRELATIDKFNKNLEESRKRVRGVVENINKIQRQLPSEINDTEVQQTLVGMSNSLKMKNPQMTPKLEISKDFYFSKDYVFDVTATFLQGLILFEKLEKLSKSGRILNVKYVKMTVDDTADKRSRYQVLKLSTIVESYRYNPKFIVKATENPTEKPTGKVKPKGVKK